MNGFSAQLDASGQQFREQDDESDDGGNVERTDLHGVFPSFSTESAGESTDRAF
jgi:hypothetical protein